MRSPREMASPGTAAASRRGMFSRPVSTSSLPVYFPQVSMKETGARRRVISPLSLLTKLPQ